MIRPDTRCPIYASNQAYVRAIQHAGGVPILIPPLPDKSALEAIQDRIDSLLLPGGTDVDPSLYGEPALPESQSPEPERDAVELAVARRALGQSLPVFAVCRGMQLLNVACGGTLYQHVLAECPDALDDEHKGRDRARITHEISVRPGSILAGILGDQRAGVNSFHHEWPRSVCWEDSSPLLF